MPDSVVLGPDTDLWLALVLLAALGLVAGWINTVAGAGSLLTLPALVFSGLDPAAANATNRVAVLATTLAAVWGYRRAGRHVSRREAMPALAAMAGAVAGASLATLMAPEQIRIAIVISMAAMLPLSMIRRKPKEGIVDDAAPLPTFGVVLAFFAIGAYGGFIQAGVGIVVVLYLAHLHGTNLVAANVVKTVAILAITIVSLSIFVVRAQEIDPLRGIVLAGGSALGGVLGAKSTLEGGEKLVRAGLVLAVIASIVKLAWDAFAG